MGRLWAAVIQQTSSSPLKLVLFGGICVAASVGLGSIFTGMMVPAPPKSTAENRKTLDGMSYDDKRFATAREQRLASMVRDMLEGHSDEHWQAAMRGTVVRHPNEEKKTQGVDAEALARAKMAAR